MASHCRLSSGHTDWMDPNNKWYILMKDKAKYNARSTSKIVPAGTMFEIDHSYDAPDSVIILKSCYQGKLRVEWEGSYFRGLDDKTKDLLLAIDEPGIRMRVFKSCDKLLLYASELKPDAKVCVSINSRYPQVAGTLRYIGPINKKRGTHFGVHLVNTCGDSNGTINGDRYFKCGANNGTFVTVDKLIVPNTYKPTKTLKELAAGGAADGLDVHPTMVNPGDRVSVKIKVQPDGSKKQTVTGTVVTKLLSGHCMGVEVDKRTGVPLHPWDGYIEGKKVFNYSTGQTVMVALSDVISSQPESFGSMPQDQIGQASSGMQSSQPTPSSRESSQPESLQSQLSSGDFQRDTNSAADDSHRAESSPSSMSISFPGGGQPHNSTVDNKGGPDSATSSVSDRGNHPGTEHGEEKKGNKGHHHETVKNHQPTGTNPPSMDSPPDAGTTPDPLGASSDVRTTHSSGFIGNREMLKPSGSNVMTAKNSSKDKQFFGWFNRAGPAPFPLKDFHINVLSEREDICDLLARDLNLLEQWEKLCRKKEYPYVRVDQFFKLWWSSINEGHRDERSKFLGLLIKYDMRDLADHINNSPDHGPLHNSVLKPFLSKAVKKWAEVATHLGVKQKELGTAVPYSMTDSEKLQEILHIWQGKEKRTECRVHEFVEMCCNIGMRTFASQVGQGLGIGVLKKIARAIPHRSILIFREALQISSVRWKAFVEFEYQSEKRIYEMLCYWSLIQPLNAPKIELLAEALKRCGLEKVAYEQLYRGLSNGDMEDIALAVGDKWFRLAKALELSDSDMVLLQGLDTSLQKAFRALQLWRWHKLGDVSTNLRGLLHSSLMTYRLHGVARRLAGAPECPSMHDSVISAVTEAIGDCWMRVAEDLHLEKFEISDIPNTMHPQEKVRMVLEMWQDREPGARDRCKIHELVGLCRAAGQDKLAMQIEQGLDENTLQSIARKVNGHQYQRLSEKLDIPKPYADALEKVYSALVDRVYQSLCFWCFMQPLEANKVEKLNEAIEQLFPHEELHVDDLGTTSAIIDDKWLQLANGLKLPPNQMKWLVGLEQQSGPSKALSALHLWRLHALVDTPDLKLTLFSKLTECGLVQAARQLYGGFDPETIILLARKLFFDWPVLAKHFGYSDYELSNRLRASNRLDMSLIVMKEWFNKSLEGGVEDTRRKLREGLEHIGRVDVTDWLNKRSESDQKDDIPTGKEANTAFKQLTTLDRKAIRQIADSLKVSQQDFMDILSINDEDMQRLPESVKREPPIVQVLVAWKKKNMQEDLHLTEQERLKQLNEILGLYGSQLLEPDGSPVDRSDYEVGAAGGIPDPSSQLEREAAVEVDYDGETLPGTIKWIGGIPGLEEHGMIAGLELEGFLPLFGADGKFEGKWHFDCQHGRGIFLPLSRCRPDSRFVSKPPADPFGGRECEPIDEPTVPPPREVNPDLVGMFKGIQGNHNSCYMDVTLYSMFAYNTVFDAILEYDHTSKECIREIKDAMRATIVNPLRRNGFVRADYLFTFRELLSNLSSMKGFRTEEKDPEEFIHALLQELLNAPPFLKISQGKNAVMDSYVYQIFLDQQSKMGFPSVEELLHMSFLQSDLKLEQMPQCLIIQLPRYGKKYKLFDHIKPTLEMDIKLLIRDVPRTCSVCGCLAFIECKDCRPDTKVADADLIQSFCTDCFKQTHTKQDKKRHEHVTLTAPKEFMDKYLKIKDKHPDEVADKSYHLYDKYQYPMELFSVVCIETSHYVAFVKTVSGNREEWVFFDSMADRTGAEDGYNIPEVVHLRYLKDQMESPNLKEDLLKPHFRHLKRLLSDAYICFYRPVHRDSLDQSWDTRRESDHDSEDQMDNSKRQKGANWDNSRQMSRHTTPPSNRSHGVSAGPMVPDEGSTGSVHPSTSHRAPDQGHQQGYRQELSHSDVNGGTMNPAGQHNHQPLVPRWDHYGGAHGDPRERRQGTSPRDVNRAIMDQAGQHGQQPPVASRDHYGGVHGDPWERRQEMPNSEVSRPPMDQAGQPDNQAPVPSRDPYGGVHGDPQERRQEMSNSDASGESAAVTEGVVVHGDNIDESFVVLRPEVMHTYY